jgi:uncharacterized protein YrrD
MLIASDDLIGLPVFTQGGDGLGKIDSFDVNIDNGLIVNYYVKTGLIKELWHEKLMISSAQVISISKEKMVVDDNVYLEKEKKQESGFSLGIASPTKG